MKPKFLSRYSKPSKKFLLKLNLMIYILYILYIIKFNFNIYLPRTDRYRAQPPTNLMNTIISCKPSLLEGIYVICEWSSNILPSVEGVFKQINYIC